jgi:hypothetical protein
MFGIYRYSGLHCIPVFFFHLKKNSRLADLVGRWAMNYSAEAQRTCVCWQSSRLLMTSHPVFRYHLLLDFGSNTYGIAFEVPFILF